MMRQQRLVGGNHVLASLQCGFDRRLGGVAFAAHQFDENVDIGVRRQFHRVVVPGELRQVVAAVLGPGTGGHRHHLDRPPGAGRHQIHVPRQNVQHPAADRSQPRNAQTQRLFHRTKPANR